MNVQAKRDDYIPILNPALRFSVEQRDFLRRRTIPFIRQGTHLSLEQIVIECYLQGLRDGIDLLILANKEDGLGKEEES